MQYTEYYELNKPESTDSVDIGDLNDNFDTIDLNLHSLAEARNQKLSVSNIFPTTQMNIGLFVASGNTVFIYTGETSGDAINGHIYKITGTAGGYVVTDITPNNIDCIFEVTYTDKPSESINKTYAELLAAYNAKKIFVFVDDKGTRCPCTVDSVNTNEGDEINLCAYSEEGKTFLVSASEDGSFVFAGARILYDTNLDEDAEEDSENPITSGAVYAALQGKQDIPTQVTTGTDITLADNTEYRLTDVTELTLAYPTGNFECWMHITTGETAPTITLPTSSYIGKAPTFGASETWELSIKDGTVVAQKVGDGV